MLHDIFKILYNTGFVRSRRQWSKYSSLFDEKNITWILVIRHNQTEIEQAIKDDCELVYQAEGITYFKKPS